jgi:fructose-1,6-bisphosphatase/inositol monophosphatase family enzyme
MSLSESDNLVEFAAGVAHEAGTIMRQYFHSADQQATTKADHTPLTAADTAINELVIRRVTEAFPQHGVLGEEASVNQDRSELWVCDPIDGTRSFIIGEPTAMFSLAFVVDGVPQIAAAYDPFQDRLLTARLGGGAQCNGEPVHVNARPLDGGTIVASGNLNDIERRWEFYKQLRRQKANVRYLGGGVFKGCLVAEGRVEGYVFPGQGAHDIAAIKLIVEEAGGKVTDLAGNEQRYDRPIRGALITNGVIHDDLVRAVAEFGLEESLGF